MASLLQGALAALAIVAPVRQIIVNPAPASPQELRIVSWNIERGVDLAAIESELRREPADLELLQEVDQGTRRTANDDVAQRLAEALHRNAFFAAEFEELGQESNSGQAYTGQATLTDLRVSGSRVIRFRAQSSFWKPRAWIPSRFSFAQRRIGARNALVTECTWQNRKLVVYNCHLESRGYGRLQLRELREMLADAQQYGPDAIILLGGDINSKYLPSYYLHVMENAGYRSVLGGKIARTHVIAMALDWLFVRGRGVQIVSGSVNRKARGSDHFPVRGCIRLGL